MSAITAATDEHPVRAQRVQLEVTGMSCAACANRVESTLNKLPGVRASVNFATRVATIDASEDTQAAALCEAVHRAGYQAELRRPGGEGDRDPDADRARYLLIRLAVAAVLFVPLADLSVMFAVVPSTRFTGWGWVLTALAVPVVTWAAWPFHRVALRDARHRGASMETLISVGITAATIWSLYTVFGHHHSAERRGIWQALLGSDAIYFEVAAGVTVFVLAGRFFEARAKSKAGGALRALAALSAKDVAVLQPDGSEMVIPADQLKEQHRFVVRPGQTIAADGLVVEGSAAVDMSAMTGEAKPVRVDPGAKVIGGTAVLDGRLIVEAAAVGADTQFAGMVRLVEQAQAQKADAQRLADRIASVFVPCVFAVAALTAAGWLVAGGAPDRAFSAALAVLVIACPCALGLATPTAMMVASGRGAQLGIFLKGHHSLEATRAVDTVVFDKTGTLTSGQLTVSAVAPAPGWNADEVLGLAATVEAASEHAVALAIVRTNDCSENQSPTSAQFPVAESAAPWPGGRCGSANRHGSPPRVPRRRSSRPGATPNHAVRQRCSSRSTVNRAGSSRSPTRSRTRRPMPWRRSTVAAFEPCCSPVTIRPLGGRGGGPRRYRRGDRRRFARRKGRRHRAAARPRARRCHGR